VEAQPCNFSLHPKTNLCQAVRAFTGRGVMKSDGQSRFTFQGMPVFHFMGTPPSPSTPVRLPRGACAAARRRADGAPLARASFGCARQ
jgi:Zn-dependent alcohol dehydrogenase